MYSNKTVQLLLVFLIGTLLTPAFANPHKIKHRDIRVKGDEYQLAVPPNILELESLADDEDHCSKYPCYNETEIENLPDAHEELHQSQLTKRMFPQGWTSSGKFRAQMLKYHN